jgi:hypothetical protein
MLIRFNVAFNHNMTLQKRISAVEAAVAAQLEDHTTANKQRAVRFVFLSITLAN